MLKAAIILSLYIDPELVVGVVMPFYFYAFLFLHMITYPQLCIAVAMHVLVMGFI